MTRADLDRQDGLLDSFPPSPVASRAGCVAIRFHAPSVGTVMSTEVRTVGAASPITELVPMFANYGHHHIPVLDAAGHWSA